MCNKILKQILIVYIIFNSITVCGQTIPAQKLFEFNIIFEDQFIVISNRLQMKWGLFGKLIRHSYYNVTKDTRWQLNNYPTQVMAIFIKGNNDKKMVELFDNGEHFDNAKQDGVYSNYFVTDLTEYKTDEYEIDVCCSDSMKINYSILTYPLNIIPSPSKIFSPPHKTKVAGTKPIIRWTIDPNSDGCKLVLLNKEPKLGVKLDGVLWQKDYIQNNNSQFIDTIPIFLNQNQSYNILIWSYSNIKFINSAWQNSAYSIEWSSFSVDTTAEEFDTFKLYQNYPNPFNPVTKIRYTLAKPDRVKIIVYSILGKEVKVLVDKYQSSGEHEVEFYAENLPSGVYIYSLVGGLFSAHKKMIYLK